MKIPFSPLRALTFGTAVVLLPLAPVRSHAQQEPPPAPVPGAEAAPAKTEPSPDALAESAIDAWLLQPATAPLPSRAEVGTYLASLLQRQEDVSKTIEFLVSIKRLQQAPGARESGTAAVPPDLTLDRWDELVKPHENGGLASRGASAALTAFAEKLQAVNAAQKAESLKLSKLMLRRADDAEPVHHRPKAVPVATPIPIAATPPPEGRTPQKAAASGFFGISKPAAPTPVQKTGKAGN